MTTLKHTVSHDVRGTHIDWQHDEVNARMIDWFWSNMEKGFILWQTEGDGRRIAPTTLAMGGRTIDSWNARVARLSCDTARAATEAPGYKGVFTECVTNTEMSLWNCAGDGGRSPRVDLQE